MKRPNRPPTEREFWFVLTGTLFTGVVLAGCYAALLFILWNLVP